VDCILCGAEFEAHDGPCPECGWNADAVLGAKSLRTGELVRGRYEVVSSLGVGRLGAAFLVTDTDTSSDAVMKLAHPGLIGNEEIGRQFLIGMRPLRKVTHPCMVRVLDANCEAQNYYVVNELVDGISLRHLMEKRRDQGKGFAVRETLPILQQIAGFFEESGILEHGSLSPENIWIKPDGLKLLDVGWAASLPAAAVGHRLASRMNARGYVAKELLGGSSPTPRSDVYSLGALVFEMFTQIPFNSRLEAVTAAAHDMPADLCDILQRALAPIPENRYANVREFENAVSEVFDSTFRSSRRSDETREPARATLQKPSATTPPSRYRTTIAPAGPPPAEHTVQIAMDDVIRDHTEGVEETMREPTQPTGKRVPWAKIAPEHGTREGGAFAMHPPPLITPKRPERKDSLPPHPVRIVPPHRITRTEPSSKALPKKSSAELRTPPPKRTVGKEIDLGGIGTDEENAKMREGTQEIDMALVESQTATNTADAVVKLEKQAADAVKASTDELIRRAERLEGVDPRLVRAAHKLEAERRGARSAKAAEIIKQRGEDLDGIDPRLLRAAARLEEARINDVPDPVKEQEPSEDWRERIAVSKEDSVVSFLASPMVEPSAEVRGFPLAQHRRPQNRPPTKPPTPVPPPVAPPPRGKKGKRGGESLARALYDEDGETDDHSQPTLLVHPAQLPRSVHRLAVDRRLFYMEMALPVMAGLLFAGMIILLAVAASMR